MAALSAARKTARYLGCPFPEILEFGVQASTTCYQGGIAVLAADGMVEPGTTATGKVACGVFEETVDNSAGADAAKTAKVRLGVFKFGNSASSDEITAAEVGDACYIVDDQTVAKTNGGSTRSAAGIVMGVDSDGVWVQIALGQRVS